MRKPKRFVKKPGTGFSTKGLLLYVLPFLTIPAAIKAFAHGNISAIAVNVLGYGMYIFSAWLLRKGFVAEALYYQKRNTRPPKWPLKTFAAFIVAIATMMIAWIGAGGSFWVGLSFGLGAFLGMYLTYGLDPRAEKLVIGSHGYSAEEIAKTIDEAEGIISAIENSNDQINNREFNKQIKQICHLARDILEILEEDPGDIRRARKFLNVYLEGAQKVTNGYAKTHQESASEELDQNFRDVLATIEKVCVIQKNKLIEDDVFDLDVQMEVLATQLKREGVI